MLSLPSKIFGHKPIECLLGHGALCPLLSQQLQHACLALLLHVGNGFLAILLLLGHDLGNLQHLLCLTALHLLQGALEHCGQCCPHSSNSLVAAAAAAAAPFLKSAQVHPLAWSTLLVLECFVPRRVSGDFLVRVIFYQKYEAP